MISCDICCVVLGKTHDSERIRKDQLCFIGVWEVCIECERRIAEQIFDDVKNKRYRKN